MIIIPNDIVPTNRLIVMVDGEEIESAYRVDTTNGYVDHYVVSGGYTTTDRIYGDITFRIE